MSAAICRYCGCTNTLSAQSAVVSVAAEEARALAEGLEARLAPLQAELAGLVERAARGDRSAHPEILDLQERILRLTYAPTLHLARHTGAWAHTLSEIEPIIADVLDSWRASFAQVP